MHPRPGNGLVVRPLLWAIRNDLAATRDLAAVSFNFRGTMGSAGTYGGGRDELFDVKIRSCLSVRPLAFLESDPEGRHFQAYNWHFSGYDRVKHDVGRTVYIPLNLGEVPDYHRRFIDPPDIAIIRTTPADENGFFNLGPTNAWIHTVVERAKTVIVEVTPNLPCVFGPTTLSTFPMSTTSSKAGRPARRN